MSASRRVWTGLCLVTLLVATLGPVLAAQSAQAATLTGSVSSAGWSGPTTSTYQAPGGSFFAQPNASLTLTVTTSSSVVTHCLAITGEFTLIQNTGNDKTTTWTFTPLAAGSGNGTSVHVVAYPDKTGGSCAGTPQGTADTSYVLDNTAPAVTGTASPTANAAGWNNSTPVTVTWS